MRRRTLKGAAFDQEPPSAMVDAAEAFIIEQCSRKKRDCYDRALFEWKVWTGRAFNQAVDRSAKRKR